MRVIIRAERIKIRVPTRKLVVGRVNLCLVRACCNKQHRRLGALFSAGAAGNNEVRMYILAAPEILQRAAAVVARYPSAIGHSCAVNPNVSWREPRRRAWHLCACSASGDKASCYGTTTTMAWPASSSAEAECVNRLFDRPSCGIGGQ